MGTALLGIVAGRRSDKTPLYDLNNNVEIATESREILLLETPPLGTRHQPIKFKPELLTQSVKIGKIARISDRKIRDVQQQVIVKVSHHFLSPWNWTVRFVNINV